MNKFITGFNGSRDFYMLPLALYEQNLLHTHLTDFYSPKFLAKTNLKYFDSFKKRYADGLPFHSTKFVLDASAAFFNSIIFKNPPDFTSIEKMFGTAALNEYEHTGRDLFLHSGYAFEIYEKLKDHNVIKCLFQYHPHALSCYDLLRDDFSKHPEVEWSFSNEEDTNIDLSIEDNVKKYNEFRFADRIYTASTFTKKTLIAQGCPADMIFVSPYGAEFSMKSNFEVREKTSFCTFLFVGQGVQRKGIHHLLKAWKIAKLKRSKLIVISRKIDPGILPLFNDESIKIYKGVDSEKLNDIYTNSDVFVMPSLVEGFGLVYPEALARGLFCIGTANTGLPDLATHDANSRIVDPGDVEGLTRALVDAEQLWSQNAFDRHAISKSILPFSWQAHRSRITDDLKAWLLTR